MHKAITIYNRLLLVDLIKDSGVCSLKLCFKSFDTFKEIVGRIRYDVFVKELKYYSLKNQDRCELDPLDSKALHILVRKNEGPSGYCRILPIDSGQFLHVFKKFGVNEKDSVTVEISRFLVGGGYRNTRSIVSLLVGVQYAISLLPAKHILATCKDANLRMFHRIGAKQLGIDELSKTHGLRNILLIDGVKSPSYGLQGDLRDLAAGKEISINFALKDLRSNTPVHREALKCA